ncbi:COX assembly mitochondrial protein homolog isoform X2 [Prorops nasuta]|uniref:COX assembly mitochondrial protein homolog isoform X2 n=1 Tax=Prorops nasuta TaxID=863751 RepID=UPI0034CE4CF5
MENKILNRNHGKRSCSGGPQGLGDPNDTSLRKVEIEILIPKIMRDRSRAEKCAEELKVFSECGKKAGLLLTFKCKKECAAFNECSAKWYTNEEFKEECKQQYLKERAEYRRTGITKKMKENKLSDKLKSEV